MCGGVCGGDREEEGGSDLGFARAVYKRAVGLRKPLRVTARLCQISLSASRSGHKAPTRPSHMCLPLVQAAAVYLYNTSCHVRGSLFRFEVTQHHRLVYRSCTYPRLIPFPRFICGVIWISSSPFFTYARSSTTSFFSCLFHVLYPVSVLNFPSTYLACISIITLSRPPS